MSEKGAFEGRLLARKHARLAQEQAVTQPTFGQAAQIVKMAAESPNRPAGGRKHSVSIEHSSIDLCRWCDVTGRLAGMIRNQPC